MNFDLWYPKILQNEQIYNELRYLDSNSNKLLRKLGDNPSCRIHSLIPIKKP